MAYILSKGRSAIHANVIVVDIWGPEAQNGEEMKINLRRGEEKVESDTVVRCLCIPSS